MPHRFRFRVSRRLGRSSLLGALAAVALIAGVLPSAHAGSASASTTGFQFGSMGESWSDLNAEEYLHENGYVPVDGEDSWAVGPYVTNDKKAGIRNYALDHNPLNYSDIGYDVTGPEVHADGEIWNAVNSAVRQELALRYALKFPPGNRTLRQACTDGKLAADQCPGNRRWIQLVYDAWLLLPSRITMVDARDAMLAADQMRFGGANQAVLWDAFARTGVGRDASSTDTTDTNPTPSFASPMETNGTLTFHPIDEHGQPVSGAQLFIGQYEARATAVADTDPATALGDSFQMVPGIYSAIARANGRGAVRLTLIVPPASIPLVVRMPENLASASNGATTSGDGVNQGALIDDTEATDWASLASPVAGKQVTVHLDPSAASQVFSRVQVSALVHPANPADPGDPGAQSRFSALRQFQLQTCLVSATVDCSSDADFHTVFTSPANAFPSVAPRPRAPELILRSFRVPATKATFVRLVVLSNQCTGTPAYAGEQDNDPRANTDCSTASVQATNVRAAELQVFAS